MTTIKYIAKNKLKFGIIIFIILLCLIVFDLRLKIRSYNIDSNKINQTVKIALLTDLHSCKYGKNQKNLITAIDNQAPDIVLLGGDICDDVIPNDNTELLLSAIANKYPIYYVTGNHEYWSNDIDTILELFKKYDVTILDGKSDTIELNGQKINICGVNDPDVIKYTNSTVSIFDQLNKLSTVSANGNYTILLSHRPELIDKYEAYNYDLVLSGHAHGGQWRIPYLLNGFLAPNQGFFPKYAGGLYNFDDMNFIVSRGLAKESTKAPRIFNPPELVIINLE